MTSETGTGDRDEDTITTVDLDECFDQLLTMF